MIPPIFRPPPKDDISDIDDITVVNTAILFAAIIAFKLVFSASPTPLQGPAPAGFIELTLLIQVSKSPESNWD